MSKSTPDVIEEWPRFAKVFFQKNFKVWPRDGTSMLEATLVLGPSIANGPTEERGCKKSMVGTDGLYCIKMIYC